MNENIKSLIEKSTTIHNQFSERFGNQEVSVFDKEKFAQLLLEQCEVLIAEVKDSYDRDCRYSSYPEEEVFKEGSLACDTIKWKIKFHFNG